MDICGNCHSREIKDLCPKNYATAADGGEASIITVQTHTEVTVSIAMNACESVLLQCTSVILFLPSMLLPSGKPLFLHSLLKALGVNHVSNMSDPSQHLHISRCPCSLPCPFCKCPWSKYEVVLLLVASFPYRRTFGILPADIWCACPSHQG